MRGQRESVIIIGAGLVGTLLSAYLARAGFTVSVYERYPDLRRVHRRSDRSVNLTLCERGFQALDAVGAGNAVRKLCVPVYGRIMHTTQGKMLYQSYGNHQEALYSIRRNDLNQLLLDFAEQFDNINFYFSEKCIDIDLSTMTLTLQNAETGYVSHRQADCIFAADGAYSAVREQLQRLKRFNYSQEYLDQGYKEINLPACADGGWPLQKNAIHFWPRDNFMLVGFPNLDRSFTLSLHMPYEGEIAHEAIATEYDLRRLFEEHFPDVLSLTEPYMADCLSRPVGAIVTIKCFPWTYQGKLALIGDACHAIFPYYGQGANAGFEDCWVLIKAIKRHLGDWQKILQEYQTLRKPDTDTIADLSTEHLTTVKKLVGTPAFLLQQKIERKIQELYHDYRPLYYNISFTCIPYAEALNVERRFQSVITKIMNIDGIEDKLDSSEIELLISKVLRESEGL